MTAADEVSVRRPRARLVLPAMPFRLGSALAATAAAGVMLVVGASMTELPEPGFSVVLFAAAPLFGCVAALILHARTQDQDAAIGWFTVGLAIGCAALLLQLVSFPAVSTGGGPLGTRGEGSALLYLTCHLAVFGCAALGAAGVSSAARPPVLIAGVIAIVAQAVNLFPSPRLLTGEQVFTPALVLVEWVLVAVGAAALLTWVLAAGARPSPQRGWVAVFLLLLIYELALNAVAGRRFDAIWWSSLSLRVGAFGALAVGCLAAVLRRAHLVESYSATELRLRDAAVRSSAAVIDQLLWHARELAAARTPTEVALTLCRAVEGLTGAAYVVVSHRSNGTGSFVRLAATANDGPPAAGDDQPMIPSLAGALGARTARFLPDSEQLDADTPGGLADTAVHWPTQPQAYAVLPLTVGELRIGSLEVAEPQPRRWSRADQEVLRGLADQAAPVLSRARLAEREHLAAQTLQRSLLPPRLPDAPGLLLAAAYQPAARELEVGGDWYDAWTLPDGRVALVVGDVVGKGLHAAATTGRLRAAIRALAATDPDPAQVLQRLDDLEADDGPTMTATVIYALLDADLSRVTIASAGHPPALLVPAGAHPASSDADRQATKSVTIPDQSGPPIGLGTRQHADATCHLHPGDTLLMYTDGLIETRTSSIDERIQTLAAIAETARSHPDHVADQLPDQLMTALQPTGDDIAILTATRTPTAPGSTSPEGPGHRGTR